jgi:hypothetical protein
MNAFVGRSVSRVEGPEKVTGQATYAAEFRLRNMAFAALVTGSGGECAGCTGGDHAPERAETAL